MKRFLGYLAAAMVLGGNVHADEAGVAAILKKWNDANKEWTTAYEFADPALRREMDKSRPNPDQYVAPLWRELEPVIDKPSSVEAVVWVSGNIPSLVRTFNDKENKKIVKKLLDAIDYNLIDQPGIGRVAYALSLSTDLRCRQILEKMRELNPNPKDQGLASLGLAIIMLEKTGILKDDERINRVRAKYIEEAIVKSFDEPFGNGRVSDFCASLLADLKHLSKGRQAPGFQLASSTGEMVKIPSGKPTLLVFCVPGNQASMSLAMDSEGMMKRFPGLDVLPVCPINEKQAAEVLGNYHLTVPVLLDAKGDVFKEYQIASAPFVYLLDGNGIVKLRGTPDIVFDVAVAEAMKQKTPAKPAARPVPVPAKKNNDQPSSGNVPVPPAPAVREPVPAPQPQGDGAPPPLRPLPEM